MLQQILANLLVICKKKKKKTKYVITVSLKCLIQINKSNLMKNMNWYKSLQSIIKKVC